MFWLNRKRTSALPFPEGPYATGCMELMNNYSKESIFLRIFYPTDVPPKDIKKRSNEWVEWLVDYTYIEAFASLLNIWLIVIKFLLFFVKKAYIPTLWEEPVSKKLNKLPVIVFSHGYGATRFLCSTVCNELASRGYIVAAIEHKDKSASITYYYDSESSRDNDKRTFIHHIPFIVDSVDHYTIRNSQLKKRSEECSAVLNILEDMNDGKPVNILKSNIDSKSLKGKIDLSQNVIMGHSFGGATSMYTLSRDNRFKIGVILDGWMFPLKGEQLEISQPMLFINTQTFHLEANIKIMKKYAELSQNTLYTMKFGSRRRSDKELFEITKKQLDE
ncbi:hypothetical protein PGB90_001942 [Kerria lacca]